MSSSASTCFMLLCCIFFNLSSHVYGGYLSVARSVLYFDYRAHNGCNDTTTVQNQCTVPIGEPGQVICDQVPTCQAMTCSLSNNLCQLRYGPLSPLLVTNNANDVVYVKLNNTNSNGDACQSGQALNSDSALLVSLGCFPHNSGQDPHMPLNPDRAQVSTCAAGAKQAGQAFFGLQWGYFCFSTSNPSYVSQAPLNNTCNEKCIWNNNDMCGARGDFASMWQYMWSPACIPCGNGYYSPDGKLCLQSPGGSYVPGSAATSYLNCSRGSYAPAGSSSCTQCDITRGESCPNDRMSAPNKVPDGYTAQTPLDTNFQPCPIGTYRGTIKFTECTPCPKGTYADTTANQFCKNAPAGRYVDTVGATNSLECPAGWYSSSASSYCTKCPAGQYTAKAGSPTCNSCTKGSQSQPNSGQTSCYNCPKYSFTFSADRVCTQCPVCSSMYKYLAGQIALGNLKASDTDWSKLKAEDAAAVGIDVAQGKAGVMLQLATCYNINNFAIDDPKNAPTQQCIFAQAPDVVPPLPNDIPTPAPSGSNPGSETGVPSSPSSIAAGSHGTLVTSILFTLAISIIVAVWH